MVFSSTTFLLAFLPLVAILYYICPRKLRNALLLVFSLLFYGWGEPKYILIMLFSTVFDYCNGLAIGHFRAKGREGGAKAVLIVSVVGNLAILGFFKYTDFAIENLNGLLGTAIPALGLLLKGVEQGLEAGEVVAPCGSACDGVPVQLRVAAGVKCQVIRLDGVVA